MKSKLINSRSNIITSFIKLKKKNNKYFINLELVLQNLNFNSYHSRGA